MKYKKWKWSEHRNDKCIKPKLEIGSAVVGIYTLYLSDGEYVMNVPIEMDEMQKLHDELGLALRLHNRIDKPNADLTVKQKPEKEVSNV